MADNETPRSEISHLGKFNLISKLTDNIKMEQPSTVVGPGDDAAVARFDNRLTVAASKLFLENVHFDLSFMPPEAVGWRLMAANASDVISMGTRPTHYLLNIAIPENGFENAKK